MIKLILILRKKKIEEIIDNYKLENKNLQKEKEEYEKLNLENNDKINKLTNELELNQNTMKMFINSNEETQKDLENFNQIKSNMEILCNEIENKQNQNEILQNIIKEQENKIITFNDNQNKFNNIIKEKNDEIEMLKKQIMLLNKQIEKFPEKKENKQNILNDKLDKYFNLFENNNEKLNIKNAVIWNSNDFN